MEYIMIGFLMAIGWTWGKAISGAVASMLLEKIQDSEWYQDTVRKTRKIETYDDIKTVKNQIGFR